MLFADYKDFKDCVSKNQDKDSPEGYCASIEKKVTGKWPAEMKKVAKYWKNSRKAKHSGLGQIPDDYKKKLDGDVKKYSPKYIKLAKHYKKCVARHAKVISHGFTPAVKTARFSGIGMKEYALVDVLFLTPGKYKTNGTPYEYDWETIEENSATFEGKPFYLNHNEKSGLEFGMIDKVYKTVQDGKKWLAAKVKVPEVKFTQNYLDRIENGLIKDVSSTHDFTVEQSSNKVQRISGKAISSVTEGEVDGAKIVGIKRGIKSPEYSRHIKSKVSKFYKKLKG